MVASSRGGSHGKVPCAKLKKQHKQLPARCKKKAPPPHQDPPSLGTIAATITLPDENGQDQYNMEFGDGALWVGDSHGLLRIDPATNSVAARIRGPSALYGAVALADGAVWYSSWDGSAVYRVDPATNTIVARVPVPAGPEGIAATPGSIWVASHYDWSVSRIDTASNRVVATIPMPGINPGCCGPQGIAATPTGVGCGGAPLARIDPVTNQVLLHGPIGDILLATDLLLVDGSLYVGVLSATTGIERIDVTTNKVTGLLAIRSLPTTRDNGLPYLAYGAGSLWVRGPGSVIRVQLTG